MAEFGDTEHIAGLKKNFGKNFALKFWVLKCNEPKLLAEKRFFFVENEA